MYVRPKSLKAFQFYETKNSNMDKLLDNRYPTHFWISIYRGFGDRLGIGARGPGVRWIVPLGVWGAWYVGYRKIVQCFLHHHYLGQN
jgi:hypothetical protein